ncbi:MAG: cytochrome c, partial [Gammaproteobacteria bacterium]|nr:cytochrome c [Gammaproteobacteria bacterium]
MRTFTKAIVTIGSAIALTAGTIPSVSADDEAAIKYRQAVMKAVGGHMGGAVAIIKGKVPYKVDLV